MTLLDQYWPRAHMGLIDLKLSWPKLPVFNPLNLHWSLQPRSRLAPMLGTRVVCYNDVVVCIRGWEHFWAMRGRCKTSPAEVTLDFRRKHTFGQGAYLPEKVMNFPKSMLPTVPKLNQPVIATRLHCLWYGVTTAKPATSRCDTSTTAEQIMAREARLILLCIRPRSAGLC